MNQKEAKFPSHKKFMNKVGWEEKMKLSAAIKPISPIKTHASEIISEISETGNPVVVTVNGEARVIIQDIAVGDF